MRKKARMPKLEREDRRFLSAMLQVAKEKPEGDEEFSGLRQQPGWQDQDEICPSQFIGEIPVSIRVEVMDPWDRLGAPMDPEKRFLGITQVAFIPRNFRIK